MSGVWRAVAVAVFIAACSSADATAGAAPNASATPTHATPTSAVSRTALPVCHPTTGRDAAGVITLNGEVGIVGETTTRDGYDSFLIVRRGAVLHQTIQVRFIQLGNSAPATWVAYTVVATPQKTPTPWGDAVAFPAGWKPIGFHGSCWRLHVDGRDTGLVLFVDR